MPCRIKSNPFRLDCLFNRLFRRRSNKTSKLSVNGPSVDSLRKGEITRKILHLMTSSWTRTKISFKFLHLCRSFYRKTNVDSWNCETTFGRRNPRIPSQYGGQRRTRISRNLRNFVSSIYNPWLDQKKLLESNMDTFLILIKFISTKFINPDILTKSRYCTFWQENGFGFNVSICL